MAFEEREVDESELSDLSKPDSYFDADLAHKKLLVVRLAEFSGMFAPPSQGRFS